MPVVTTKGAWPWDTKGGSCEECVVVARGFPWEGDVAATEELTIELVAMGTSGSVGGGGSNK